MFRVGGIGREAAHLSLAKKRLVRAKRRPNGCAGYEVVASQKVVEGGRFGGCLDRLHVSICSF